MTDKIYAEELAKAKNSPEVTERFYDPYAVSEVEARKRLAPLSAQWKKEDRELEAAMQEDMMNNTSMGEMYRMQQEMMKQYGYTAPAAK